MVHCPRGALSPGFLAGVEICIRLHFLLRSLFCGLPGPGRVEGGPEPVQVGARPGRAPADHPPARLSVRPALGGSTVSSPAPSSPLAHLLFLAETCLPGPHLPLFSHSIRSHRDQPGLGNDNSVSASPQERRASLFQPREPDEVFKEWGNTCPRMSPSCFS